MDATTRRLARYAVQTRYEELPPQALHECRRRLIDSLGCAAGAVAEPYCATVHALALHYAGTPPARLWGSGERTSLEMAAFANGTLLRYLDFSDTFLGRAAGHPSDMIGALVAAAEAHGRDWGALMTAITVAYEVYCSLCAAVALQSRGIDQGSAAAVGTAAGVGRLLGLDEERMGHAIALALAANLHLYNVRCGTLSDWKGSGGPNGARNGVFAAQLAQAGVTGPSAAVEGQGGLQAVVGAFDWQVGTHGQPLVMQTHLKFHPVCYHGQSAIDAALTLRGMLAVDDIDAIEVDTYEAAFRVMGSDAQRWAPTTRETADHSLPFTIAVALIDGRLSSSAYAPERLTEPRTRALMARISVRADATLSAGFPMQSASRVTIRSSDGVTRSHLQDQPKGHAAHPLTDSELSDKFLGLHAPRGPADHGRRVLDALWSAARQDSVSALLDLVCSAARH